MKRILFLITILLSAFSTAICQGLEFNFGTRNYGWYAQNNCSLEQNDRYLKINILGDDPYFMSPGNLKVEASKYKKIKIKLLNQTSHVLDIFWTSNDYPYIRPEARQRCLLGSDSCYENNSGFLIKGFIEYTIDLTENKEWKGLIYQLRIDPGDGPDPDNINNGKIQKEEYMLIEYLKFSI